MYLKSQWNNGAIKNLLQQIKTKSTLNLRSWRHITYNVKAIQVILDKIQQAQSAITNIQIIYLAASLQIHLLSLQVVAFQTEVRNKRHCNKASILTDGCFVVLLHCCLQLLVTKELNVNEGKVSVTRHLSLKLHTHACTHACTHTSTHACRHTNTHALSLTHTHKNTHTL